jgi:thiol-disulfide isomerase/thioredoxin
MWIEAALLVLLLVIVYRFVWKPVSTPKREVPVNTAKLYLFYTTWCGYSKKAMPIWESVKAELESSPIFGNTRVEAVSIDADQDPKTASLYEVNAYPTIKLETSTGLHDFNQSITRDNLLNFLRLTLGKESKSL